MSAFAAIVVFISHFGFGFASNIGNWGAVGDFFGGVLNPMFALFSLILIAHTLMQNKKALEQSEKAIEQGTKAIEQNEKALQVSNKELELTRNELANSSKALEEQASLLAVQSFETTFFNMLELHNKNLSRIKFSSNIDEAIPSSVSSKRSYGNSSIYEGIESIKQFIKIINLPSEVSIHNYCLEAQQNFTYFYRDFGHLISSYFIHLYQILKLINKSKFGFNDKKNYSNILRSQLTNYELSLLILNCLNASTDNGEYKKLIIKFELLEHLDIEYRAVHNRFRLNNPDMYFSVNNIKDLIHFDNNNKILKSAFGKNRKMNEYFESKQYLRD
jgi:hypothetical protein